LSDFNKTLLSSTDVRKYSNIKVLKFVKWQPSSSMRTDGHTDMTS